MAIKLLRVKIANNEVRNEIFFDKEYNFLRLIAGK